MKDIISRDFLIDPEITSSCLYLGDWPISRVFLKNNAYFPWLILVPRIENIREIDDIPQKARYQLMDEISQLCSITRSYFQPDKLNIAYLGNKVNQLHIHIVARFLEDILWPEGIWQPAQPTACYDNLKLTTLLSDLRTKILS